MVLNLLQLCVIGELYWIETINDDGNATIRAISYDCKLTESYSIGCAEMMSLYVPRLDVKFPELLAYPQNAPHRNTEWIENVYKSKVVVALDLLTAKFGDVGVVCKSSPMAVFSNMKFKINECVLVPTTTKIKIVSADESDAFFSCEGDAPDGKVLELVCLRGSDMPIPAWFVTSTTDPKEANMKVSMVKVDVGAIVSTRGKVKGASSSSVIDVPLLVNKKQLSAGDQLKYFRPSKPQGLKRPFDLV